MKIIYTFLICLDICLASIGYVSICIGWYLEHSIMYPYPNSINLIIAGSIMFLISFIILIYILLRGLS